MAGKVIWREVRVGFEDVDDDGSPGEDVAGLRVGVEEDVGADDVGAEARDCELDTCY